MIYCDVITFHGQSLSLVPVIKEPFKGKAGNQKTSEESVAPGKTDIKELSRQRRNNIKMKTITFALILMT